MLSMCDSPCIINFNSRGFDSYRTRGYKDMSPFHGDPVVSNEQKTGFVDMSTHVLHVAYEKDTLISKLFADFNVSLDNNNQNKQYKFFVQF